MSVDQEKLQEAIQAVQEKASEDASFRQLCLDNPSEAAKQVTDIEIPQDFTFQFVESNGTNMTIPLPEMREERELDDSELTEATGGVRFSTFARTDASDVTK